VLGAIVRGKLFGALRMEIPPHFIHGFASGIARRTKDPSTLRATRCLSILFFDPYQFAGRASLALMEHMVPNTEWVGHKVGPFSIKLHLAASGISQSLYPSAESDLLRSSYVE
jgi:hypothetical protein